jgi:3-deoxy-D-manno-octulosonic-acid transferase
VRLAYLLAVYLAAPVVSALFLWRGLRERSYWRNFGERFGFGARLSVAPIWIHAVSVGEVQAATPLAQALRERYPEVPVLLSTFTPTGAARARAALAGGAEVRYLPYDLPGAVRRFLDRIRPRLAIIVETELWPNLYRECHRRRVPLLIASARLSPRSARHYQLLGTLFREALAARVVVAAQAEGDAERFRSLGASEVNTHVTGNLKFDYTLPPAIAARGQQLRRRYAADRPMWVAGSTHGGAEERTLLEAHRRLRAAHPEALLVLAPRHPNRFAEVAAWLEASGTPFVLHSLNPSSAAAAGAQIVLLDTLGELLDCYAAADVAFVGGSLVPVGGHNLLEPAALGVPILTGPHTFNAEEIARLLTECGAAQIVTGAEELAARLAALLEDARLRAERGARARAVVEANRGALAKLLALIEPLLESESSASRPGR